jgi:hypothetical protein
MPVGNSNDLDIVPERGPCRRGFGARHPEWIRPFSDLIAEA